MSVSDSVEILSKNNEHDICDGFFRFDGGLTRNSYIIKDDKNVLIGLTVGYDVESWISWISASVYPGKLDYVVVPHIEMDQFLSLERLIDIFPNVKIVGPDALFEIFGKFCDSSYRGRQVAFSDGSSLCVGRHVLKFFTAPGVYGPESFVCYESNEGILFSGSLFSTYGKEIHVSDDDECDAKEEWKNRARVFFYNVLSPYSQAVNDVVQKISGLNIKLIAPVYGMIVDDNIGEYMDLYGKWSRNEPESDGVFIVCSSATGNGLEYAARFSDYAGRLGGYGWDITWLQNEPMIEFLPKAFYYKKIVFVSYTCNNDVSPLMRQFIQLLKDRNFHDREVALFGYGTWNPCAAAKMREMLDGCSGIKYLCDDISAVGSMDREAINKLFDLAEQICGKVEEEKTE